MERCKICKHNDVFWVGGGCNRRNGGERCKFKLKYTPDELAAELAELKRYRALGQPQELVKVVRCKDCKWN